MLLHLVIVCPFGGEGLVKAALSNMLLIYIIVSESQHFRYGAKLAQILVFEFDKVAAVHNLKRILITSLYYIDALYSYHQLPPYDTHPHSSTKSLFPRSVFAELVALHRVLTHAPFPCDALLSDVLN